MAKKNWLKLALGRNKKKAIRWLNAFGVDPLKVKHALRGIWKLLGDYRAFRSQVTDPNKFPMTLNYPCLTDYYEKAGTASGHYFHQDLLVAQEIFAHNPDHHVDVGSRIDGFVAHVAAFREIEVLDIRPVPGEIKNIVFRRLDLMAPVEKAAHCCDSLSCLHVLEHLGLGRYGDTITPDGYITGFDHLCSLLTPGGILYLSVPIGPQRIEFNAHRVFAISTILELARDKMELVDFSYVDDLGDLHKHVKLSQVDIETAFDCQYGCGIFVFRKYSTP